MTRTALRLPVTIAASLLLALACLVGLSPKAHAAESTAVLWTNNWPTAVLPGQTVALTVTFGNYSKTATKVQYRPEGTCFSSAGAIVDFNGTWTTYTVPGYSKAATESTLTVKTNVLVPTTCAAQPDTWAVTGYTASGLLKYGTPGADQLYFSSSPLNYNIYKTFNTTNYLYNLKMRVAPPAYAAQAHHTLPQNFRSTFSGLGINIDDPGYLRWWCSVTGVKTNHASNSAAYTKLWTDWLAAHPNRTKADVFAFRSSIQGKFIYTC